MANYGVRATIAECIREKRQLRVYFYYSDEAYYLFPLSMGDSWFLAAEENDFQLNGYTVRRIADIDEAEPIRGKVHDILVAEGLTAQLSVPMVDVSRSEAIFRSLMALKRCIIVENSDSDDDYNAFIIGNIEKVCKSCVYIRHFNADGEWEPKPRRVPYGDFTSVSFASRYIEVFIRHIEPPPAPVEVVE